jgi:peroxiredoxin
MNERKNTIGEHMHPQKMIHPGDPAGNFSLKDQTDETFDLFENMEKRTLLSFHPLAWTAFCAGQMKSLEDNVDTLSSLNTVAVGISVDSVPCKKAWAEKLGITRTRLLSDFWPHGLVAQQYGLFRDANGFSERANVLVDEKQKVVFVKVYPVHSVPDMQEVITFIKNLKTP